MTFQHSSSFSPAGIRFRLRDGTYDYWGPEIDFDYTFERSIPESQTDYLDIYKILEEGFLFEPEDIAGDITANLDEKCNDTDSECTEDTSDDGLDDAQDDCYWRDRIWD